MSDTRSIFIRPNSFPAVFGISRSRAFELLADGTIPARKVGRSTLVATADVEEYLRSLPVGLGEVPTAAIKARKAKRGNS